MTMTAILFAFLVGISEVCRTNDTVTICDTYTLAVQAAGYDAVVIPRTTDTNSLRRVVRALDLVIFSGGVDVEPWRYGARPSPRLGSTNAGRDAYDFALFEACKREGKPILGICRGCQALNVAFGGTLVQDIPTEHTPPEGRARCIHGKYPYAGGRTNPPLHEVSFVAGTRLAKVLGTDPMKVNSHHHQAVMDVAPGFRIAAQAPDGVIEAIEHETQPIYGIQFHPELTVARRPQTGFDIPRHLELFKRLPELAERPDD